MPAINLQFAPKQYFVLFAPLHSTYFQNNLNIKGTNKRIPFFKAKFNFFIIIKISFVYFIKKTSFKFLLILIQSKEAAHFLLAIFSNARFLGAPLFGNLWPHSAQVEESQQRAHKTQLKKNPY